MGGNSRLNRTFFMDDVLSVAPLLPGKYLCLTNSNEKTVKHIITEAEAYRGEEDMACHARRGRTPRTDVMYRRGGYVYMYLIYGIHWMLNIVTGREGDPQAALIRGIKGYEGPGKLTRHLGIDGSYYGEDLTQGKKMWVEDSGMQFITGKGKRIGIDYAGEYWRDIEWRFYLK